MNPDEIRALCEAEGLQLSEIQHMGQILVLMPRSLEELPGFEVLSGLSEKIRARSDYRFITIGIDEVTFGDEALKAHNPEECLS